jgi:hypothetical protein
MLEFIFDFEAESDKFFFSSAGLFKRQLLVFLSLYQTAVASGATGCDLFWIIVEP